MQLTKYNNFDKLFVGFSDQYNRMLKLHDDMLKVAQSYPPYSIKKLDDNKYSIEMAVAGFAKNNIDITLDDDKLIIKGFHHDDSKDTEADVLYGGIANRAFTRMFALSDYMVVYNAELINGMLKIYLETIIPEDKKPKKIEIE